MNISEEFYQLTVMAGAVFICVMYFISFLDNPFTCGLESDYCHLLSIKCNFLQFYVRPLFSD